MCDSLMLRFSVVEGVDSLFLLCAATVGDEKSARFGGILVGSGASFPGVATIMLSIFAPSARSEVAIGEGPEWIRYSQGSSPEHVGGPREGDVGKVRDQARGPLCCEGPWGEH